MTLKCSTKNKATGIKLEVHHTGKMQYAVSIDGAVYCHKPNLGKAFEVMMWLGGLNADDFAHEKAKLN